MRRRRRRPVPASSSALALKAASNTPARVVFPSTSSVSPTRLVVTPDGSKAFSVAADAIRCWDLTTGAAAGVFGTRKGAYCWGMAISADGKTLITGCGGKQAHVFFLE